MSSAEKGVWSFSEFLQEQAGKREAAPASAVPERLSSDKRLSGGESLSLNESLSPDAPKGYRAESHLSDERLSSPESLSNNLWASIAEVKGHTRLPHAVTDKLFQFLDVPERVVYEQMFRLSWGFGNALCKVSLPVIAARAGLGRSATHAAIKRLEGKGLVVKESYVFGRTKEQATTYRLPLPEWLVRNERLSRNESLSPSGPNKENTLKETHNTGSVRVRSRFELAECRRYAESLRSDGITNPGGYATKIHRSGEADDLIEAFLTPTEAASKIDASQCPDCHGTGFWEPGGIGKGVARCRHEQLLNQS